MTPYTIRERRANMDTWKQSEGYPGQKERTLQHLIDGDAVLAAKERDLAAEARHGGQAITEYLQRFTKTPETIALAEAYDENVWSYNLSPSGEGLAADRLARLAKSYAKQGSNESFPKTPRITLAQAQAMFDWPIYREATNR